MELDLSPYVGKTNETPVKVGIITILGLVGCDAGPRVARQRSLPWTGTHWPQCTSAQRHVTTEGAGEQWLRTKARRNGVGAGGRKEGRAEHAQPDKKARRNTARWRQQLHKWPLSRSPPRTLNSSEGRAAVPRGFDSAPRGRSDSSANCQIAHLAAAHCDGPPALRRAVCDHRLPPNSSTASATWMSSLATPPIHLQVSRP